MLVGDKLWFGPVAATCNLNPKESKDFSLDVNCAFLSKMKEGLE